VKAGRSEGESEAARVPERAKQAASDRACERAWIDRNIWTDRMLAALDNGVKGDKWFSLIDKVYRAQTLAGLGNKSNPTAARRVSTDKASSASGPGRAVPGRAGTGTQRRTVPALAGQASGNSQRGRQDAPAGDPTVKDRIAQTAVKRVIEPIFEKMFLPTSYGFRPGKGCKDALRQVEALLKAGHTHVVDADLQGYFDSIPHPRLKERSQRGAQRRTPARAAGRLARTGHRPGAASLDAHRGTPQGAVISPLLANLYLHSLDERMAERGLEMVRYADDFVILCPTAEQAEGALAEVKAWVEANGLTLHPEKTHVGNCCIEGQGFEFLGYRFEAGKRQVRKKSLNALKDKIRDKTRRTRGQSLGQIIAELNPMLKGWFGYFKHAHRWVYPALDGFIRRRLRALLRKQEKRPGAGRCYSDQRRWPNRFFAAAGLFTMTSAWQSASQSR
jgi:RNA-directed DNA polymerase